MSWNERSDGGAVDMIDFQVIGELRNNPHHLLLLGDDGKCYGFDIAARQIIPLDPDGSWAADVILDAHTHIEVPSEMLAS